MLSKKEREELLEDGYSPKRREEFVQAKRIELKSSRSLDEFIRFLMDVQRVFSPFANSRKKTITRLNKL